MKHVLRFREVDRDKFEALRNGEKPIETRAATPKYQNIHKNDSLVVVCGQDKFEKTVKEAAIYPSLGSLFKNHDFREILPDSDSEAEAIAIIESFPGYKEKIRKNGIIALRV